MLKLLKIFLFTLLSICLIENMEIKNALSDTSSEKFLEYKKAAEKGDADAQNNLGYCFFWGYGIYKDLDKAFYWFKKSSDQGNDDATNNLKILFSDKIDKYNISNKDKDNYNTQISHTNAKEQYKLGMMYYKGQGVAKDYKEAFTWFKKAAEQGYAPAQNNLGYCYEKGIGTSKDENQAFYWFKKAAEQGDAAAQNWLGYCYRQGIGTSKDENQAFYWYKKAAEQGYPAAQNWLGYCYRQGIGTSKDENQAFYWFKKAAEQGYPAAQYNLGYCYMCGIGVLQDVNQAFYWCKKAADQGYPDAQKNLGDSYLFGVGVSKDANQAFYWYKKAAEQGLADAQDMLGDCYFKGYGVSKDVNQAFYWYKKAANQNYDQAKLHIAYLIEYGYTGTFDIDESYKYYNQLKNSKNKRLRDDAIMGLQRYKILKFLEKIFIAVEMFDKSDNIDKIKYYVNNIDLMDLPYEVVNEFLIFRKHFLKHVEDDDKLILTLLFTAGKFAVNIYTGGILGLFASFADAISEDEKLKNTKDEFYASWYRIITMCKKYNISTTETIERILKNRMIRK